MTNFENIRELIRAFSRGERLLTDMFSKRKTVPIHYDEALEVLDDDQERLEYLIRYGIIVRTGDTLELEETYEKFFEEVLAINEDISIGIVKDYIQKLQSNINYYLSSDNPSRKQGYLREVRRVFMKISYLVVRSAVDLRRNVDETYKQEPEYKIKKIRLREFDECSKVIRQFIRETEKIMTDQTIFFATAMDVDMKQTIVEVQKSLHETAHDLIDISSQIIIYLNKIEYQSKVVKKIRQLKYMRDQFMIRESTDIETVLSGKNPVFMESRPKYTTKISLDFMRNSDAALALLKSVQGRHKNKTNLSSKLSGKIDSSFLHPQEEICKSFNHKEIMNAFLAQGADLFEFVWNYQFQMETGKEERLVLFIQLASQFDEQLRYTAQSNTKENVEYPIIYPR